jgi:glycosyltransferase 2 family protein
MRLAINFRTIDWPSFSSGMSRSPARLAASMGKLLLSGSLIGYLLYHHGPDYARLKSIDPVLCMMAVAVFVLQIALNTIRWGLILTHLTGTKPPYYRVFGIYYASTFFSQILPSVGGDLVRVLYRRVINSTLGSMAISVILDRGVAIAALLFVALPSVPLLAPFDPDHTVLRWVVFVAGSGLAAAYGGCLILRAVRHSRIWMGLPQWTRTLAVSGAWSISSRTGLCFLIPLSLAVHLLSFTAIYLAAHAVQVPLTFLVVLAIGPVLLLAHVFPISIGGWGVREAAAVGLLGMTGVDATSALLVSIMFGVLLVLATLPGALFWLMLRE